MQTPVADTPTQLREIQASAGLPLIDHAGLDSAADLKIARWRGAFDEIVVRPRDDFHTIVLALNGESFCVDRRGPSLTKRTVTLRPIHAGGTFASRGEIDHIHIYLRADMVARVAQDVFDKPPSPYALPEVPAVHDASLFGLLRTCCENCLSEPSATRLQLDAWGTILATRLMQTYTSVKHSASVVTELGSSAGLKRACDLIESALDQDLSIEALAEAAGMTRFRFSKAFKRELGVSPHQFVLQRRVARARQMLAATEKDIAQIAYAVGFSSQAHLTQAFKERVGTTPRKFRLESSGQYDYG